jgi:hypothetical protein
MIEIRECMTETHDIDPRSIKGAKLPRRDWILLPVLSLLTICLIAGSTEMIARRMFTSSTSSMQRDCWTTDASGSHAIPNSVCWEKVPEGTLTEFRLNSCGDRAGMECGPKTPKTFRIVMVGTSFALGAYVPRERSFAALLPIELSRETGRNIELYNEANFWGVPQGISQDFNRVLDARPDLILWTLTPWDIGNTPFESNEKALVESSETAVKDGPVERTFHRIQAAVTTSSFWRHALESWHQDETNLFLRHFLYESQSLYLKSYLKGSMRSNAGFLIAEPNAELRDHLRGTDIYAADIEGQARTAGVPLVAVLLPNRAQAAMISMSEWPAGYDPYKLDNELRAIITMHGGIYIDILPDFRNIPHPERYYLPVDGHPTAEGHRIISDLLARQLTSGAVPALRMAANSQAAQEHGR